MAKFPVSEKKEKSLLAQMEQLGLLEKDLDEQFITSSGPGGQNVNKNATGVRLKHRPTGLEVKMVKERTQGLNRFFARRRLVEKMQAKTLGKESPEEIKRQKIRRQKNRRKRRSKEKNSG